MSYKTEECAENLSTRELQPTCYFTWYDDHFPLKLSSSCVAMESATGLHCLMLFFFLWFRMVYRYEINEFIRTNSYCKLCQHENEKFTTNTSNPMISYASPTLCNRYLQTIWITHSPINWNLFFCCKVRQTLFIHIPYSCKWCIAIPHWQTVI